MVPMSTRGDSINCCGRDLNLQAAYNVQYFVISLSIKLKGVDIAFG